MKLQQALDHFQTNRPGLARLLEISPQAVNKWGDVVPLDKAAILTKKSAGGLAIEWPLYDERGKPRKDAA
jgi:hypothetical protein